MNVEFVVGVFVLLIYTEVLIKNMKLSFPRVKKDIKNIKCFNEVFHGYSSCSLEIVYRQRSIK